MGVSRGAGRGGHQVSWASAKALKASMVSWVVFFRIGHISNEIGPSRADGRATTRAGRPRHRARPVPIFGRGFRPSLGGLSSREYLVHVHATVLHAASLTLALAAKPLSAWSLSSRALLEPDFPWLITLCGGGIAAVTALSSIQHFWFWRPKYRESAD
jgi:hypothetical protein